MNSYVIVYDIVADATATEVYSRLYEAIRAYGTWAHITESCWAIKTESSTVDVRDALLRLMRPTDRLFVVQTSHIAAWNNTLCKNDWLKENI